MKNTEKNINKEKIVRETIDEKPTVFDSGYKTVWFEDGSVGEFQILSFLSSVSDSIKNTNDLCKVLLKLVGDFEDKTDRKVNLITFGPKHIGPRPVEGRTQRNIKIRWAEFEEKIIQTEMYQ